jgi:hypothetical protein
MQSSDVTSIAVGKRKSNASDDLLWPTTTYLAHQEPSSEERKSLGMLISQGVFTI